MFFYFKFLFIVIDNICFILLENIGIVFDFFVGFGIIVYVVINFNWEDKGNCKYILVE